MTLGECGAGTKVENWPVIPSKGQGEEGLWSSEFIVRTWTTEFKVEKKEDN